MIGHYAIPDPFNERDRSICGSDAEPWPCAADREAGHRPGDANSEEFRLARNGRIDSKREDAPPWCQTCGGNREVNVCPPSCNGSHVADYPRTCPDCAGTGSAQLFVEVEERRACHPA